MTQFASNLRVKRTRKLLQMALIMHTSLTEAMRVRVQQPSSCIQNGKRVAEAYDRLAPTLAATLLIEIITRWFKEGLEDPPREIALRSSRLSSSLLKEVSAWES